MTDQSAFITGGVLFALCVAAYFIIEELLVQRREKKNVKDLLQEIGELEKLNKSLADELRKIQEEIRHIRTLRISERTKSKNT